MFHFIFSYLISYNVVAVNLHFKM